MRSSLKDDAPAVEAPVPTRPPTNPGLWLLCLLLVVAPTKFGAVVGAGGLPVFPLSIDEWLFGLWPPSLAAVVAGVILLTVVAWTPRDRRPPLSLRGWLPVLPAVVLAVGALPGYVRTTEWALAVPMFWHLLSFVAIAVAVQIQLFARPDSFKWILGAIGIGAILCMYGTIQQVFFGFEDTRRMIEAMAASGQTLPPGLLNRANQTRAFAFFTYPNNLAAHFLIAIPIVVAVAYRLAEHFEPVKVSRLVLAGFFVVVGGWCFYQTGSLGAMVAAAGAAGGTLLLQVFASNRRVKSNLAGLAILLAVAAAILLGSSKEGRLASVGARAEYYRCAIKMGVSQPALGVGWGEFYPWYMRLKQPKAEETRLPHNLLLSFFSQAGLIGGLAAALFLLHPYWLQRAARRYGYELRPFWQIPIALALFGWMSHALADFNLMIPGTMLTVAALTPILLHRQSADTADSATSPTPIWILLALAIASLGAVWMMPGERAYQQMEAALRARNLPLAAKFHKTASAKMPYSPHPDDLWARSAAGAGAWQDAVVYWQRAVERAPHRSGYQLRLAEARLQIGDLAGAKTALDAAETWYPHSPHLPIIRAKWAAQSSTASDP